MNAHHRAEVSQSRTATCLTRRQVLARGSAGLAAGALFASRLARPAYAQEATPHSATPQASTEDFTGLVDIGGRNIFVETRGVGTPTVVFLSGYRTSGMYWTNDLLHPEAPRTMVMPGVAEFTHTATYDRPGTYAPTGEDVIPSRSDAVKQPRTAPEIVDELQAMLQAAAIPGPYVLAAHSLGGLFARLYASTYPDNVVGMVLVDAYSERLETLLTPDSYERLKKLNQGGGTDTILPIPGYGDVETLPWGSYNDVMRKAAAESPLRPMPLAVLAHGKAFPLPTSSGFTSEELEPLLRKASEDLATLVPQGRFTVASESGHDIHQDQPQLVIEAIRQVVAGVRDPETWYSMTSCCAK